MVLEMGNHDTCCSHVCMCVCAHMWVGQWSASSVLKFLCLGTEAESLTSLELTNCLASEPKAHLFPPASASSGL